MPAGVDFRIGVKPIGGFASLTVLRGGKRIVLPMKLEGAAGDDAARRRAAQEPLAVAGRAGGEPVAGGDGGAVAERRHARA